VNHGDILSDCTHIQGMAVVKIVKAIENYFGVSYNVIDIFFRDSLDNGLNRYFGIDVRQGFLGRFGLILADTALQMQELPVQVSGLNRVTVADLYVTYTGKGQIECSRTSKAAGANDAHLRPLEFLLGVGAPAGEQHLSLISFQVGHGV
jgi:hypothetical protein